MAASKGQVEMTGRTEGSALTAKWDEYSDSIEFTQGSGKLKIDYIQLRQIVKLGQYLTSSLYDYYSYHS